MTTVADLEPGDRLTMPWPFGGTGEKTSTFVAQCPHPLWPHLQLVIWRMDDLTWSHDALDARQELPGTIDRPADGFARLDRLHKAILGAP